MARGVILSIIRKRTRKAPRAEAMRYREYNGHYYYRCDNNHEVQVTDIEYFNAMGRLALAESSERGPRTILRKRNHNS
jgi:hypothetical protein